MSEESGGRVFFARARRAPDRDSEIRLISVGVDIGSATSHLAFSRLVLRRKGGEAALIRRELLHESGICLTPYAEGEVIDTEALGGFIAGEYARADIDPDAIDTGALILTGLAARRRNARAIGELFAAETGRGVAVTAGDALETVLAAHGSGAVAASSEGETILNLDIGGGTAKIARCRGGEIAALTAIDIGARLVTFDADGRIGRIEPAGQTLLDAAGLNWQLGEVPEAAAVKQLAVQMAQCLFEASGAEPLSPLTARLLRLAPMPDAAAPHFVGFSGGVAEYLHGREARHFGDLGPALAQAVRARFRAWRPFRFNDHGIRATVVGASQFSVQLSGNTIYVDPPEVLPITSLPAIRPQIDWDALAAEPVQRAVEAALQRMDLHEKAAPVALAYDWQGDATHDRIAAFCTGVAAALAGRQPLVLVGSGDYGGLLGTHLRRAGLAQAIISIDGVRLRELDHIDIGEMLQMSGGVPVVVKSLVF